MSVASAGIQVVSVMCGALITSCRLPCFAHIFREVENQHKCGNLHVYHLYTQNLAQLVTNLSRILVSVWGEHFGAVSRFRLGIKRTKNTIFKKIKIFDKSAPEVTVVSYINVLSYQEYTLSSILQYIVSRTRRHKTDIDIGSLLCLCSLRWRFLRWEQRKLLDRVDTGPDYSVEMMIIQASGSLCLRRGGGGHYTSGELSTAEQWGGARCGIMQKLEKASPAPQCDE